MLRSLGQVVGNFVPVLLCCSHSVGAGLYSTYLQLQITDNRPHNSNALTLHNCKLIFVLVPSKRPLTTVLGYVLLFAKAHCLNSDYRQSFPFLPVWAQDWDFITFLIDSDRYLTRRKENNYLNELFLILMYFKLYLISVDCKSHKTNKTCQKTITGEILGQ